MVTYKTPNVYVEEITTLPPSVAEVSTAIPAFIGYTQKNGQDLTGKPTRINTLLEYENIFGKAQETAFTVEIDADNQITKIEKVEPKYLMHYALRMYFNNGGGSCYIVSTGYYESARKRENFEDCLAALKKEDEPTLILLTDAVANLPENDYYALCQASLAQCGLLKDRFAVFDVLPDKIESFRTGIGTNDLKYGAAYYPYLQTTLNYYYTEDSVTINQQIGEFRTNNNGILITYNGPDSDKPKGKIVITGNTIDFSITNPTLEIQVPSSGAIVADIVSAWDSWEGNKEKFNIQTKGDGSQNLDQPVPQTPLHYQQDPNQGKYETNDPNGIVITYDGPQSENPQVEILMGEELSFNITNKTLQIKLPSGGASPKNIVNKWNEKLKLNQDIFNILVSGDGSKRVNEIIGATDLKYNFKLGAFGIKNEKTDLYNRIKTELDKQRVVLPPSSAVAGVYAKVDRERGVWKAPANVSLASVIAPTVKITNEEQEDLNVAPTAGKSINAIRSFTGKGTLIWGARTLAGNDNEWRYIPVRRLFNLIEESIQKSTAFVVFESNNAITWLKVKSMVETYLDSLWRQGALAGATPEEAYFVNVGLGKSMTEQDILEGRMIIEIGIAAVRPAEFIILRFSHKLQQA
ncbi:MAG: phage tail sheath C-terminal domain-containing protein [Prochloraceae cyanobacterium]|nr:phage tail sheath C-terminal domain-containing protein [Prochloraceae cyanobacterium]